MADTHRQRKLAEQEQAVLRVADLVRRKMDGLTALFDRDDHPDGEQQLGVLRRSLEQPNQELTVSLYLRREEREDTDASP